MAAQHNYNHEFTDADVARLCQIAPYARESSQSRFYACLWLTGDRICNTHARISDTPDHLRSHHGVTGPDQTPLICCWVDCHAEMRRESLLRHISEKHLELKYACPVCNEQFTRAPTLHNHISRKHSGA